MKRFLSVVVLLSLAFTAMGAKTVNNYVVPTKDDFSSFGNPWQYDKYDTLLTVLAGILSTGKNYDGLNVARIDVDSIYGMGTLSGNPTLDSVVVSVICNVTGRVTTDSIGLLDVVQGNPLIDSAQITVLSGLASIAGNPACDSLQQTDVISGNPVMDSAQITTISGMATIYGNPTADSLVVSEVANVTGLIICDSITQTAIISGNPTFDSIAGVANIVIGTSAAPVTDIDTIDGDTIAITVGGRIYHIAGNEPG